MERTTHQGSLGPENAPTWTARRTPTAQIRRGLASKVVAVVRAEIFALPRLHAHTPHPAILLELLELLFLPTACGQRLALVCAGRLRKCCYRRREPTDLEELRMPLQTSNPLRPSFPDGGNPELPVIYPARRRD